MHFLTFSIVFCMHEVLCTHLHGTTHSYQGVYEITEGELLHNGQRAGLRPQSKRVRTPLSD